MSKRARYDGPHPEVRVAVLHQGDVYREKFVTVKQGGLLPLQTDDGETVPAAVRDDLIANRDDFSAVEQSTGNSGSKDGEK
jgi:hypothetical protein